MLVYLLFTSVNFNLHERAKINGCLFWERQVARAGRRRHWQEQGDGGTGTEAEMVLAVAQLGQDIEKTVEKKNGGQQEIESITTVIYDEEQLRERGEETARPGVW